MFQKNQIQLGAVLNYAIIIVNTIIGLVYTPYMLRMLGQSEYGIYSLVGSIIQYLTILDLGFGNAVIRYTSKLIAENKRHEQYVMFGTFLILYSTIALLTLIIGSILLYNADGFFSAQLTPLELERAKIMMIIFVINLAITFPLSIFGAILTAYQQFVFPRIVNLIRLILNTLLMVVLLNWGYKAIALVMTQTIFNIVSLLLNVWYCKHKLNIRIIFEKIDWSFLKEVAIFSLWVFIGIIIDRVYWSTGQFILAAVVSSAAVAIFAVAVNMTHIYIQFSTAINTLFLPSITEIVTQNNDYKTISNLFIRVGRSQFCVIGFIITLFTLFGRAFFTLWAGPEYEDSFFLTLIFFWAMFIPLIENLGIIILQARNQLRFRSLTYLIIAFFSVIFQIILSKRYGYYGCAIAIAGTLLIGQGIIMNIYYHVVQKIDIITFWKEIGKMAIIPIILGLLGYYILRTYVHINDWGSLFLYAGIFSIIYLPSFYLFSLNQYEKTFIKHILLKK